MTDKNIITEITDIDTVSVLKEKYNTNTMMIDGVLMNIDGTPYGELPADFAVKKQELINSYNARMYQRKRALEYPKIVDQLDLIFHEGLDKWKEVIQAVKDKYPKPE